MNLKYHVFSLVSTGFSNKIVGICAPFNHFFTNFAASATSCVNSNIELPVT